MDKAIDWYERSDELRADLGHDSNDPATDNRDGDKDADAEKIKG